MKKISEVIYLLRHAKGDGAVKTVRKPKEFRFLIVALVFVCVVLQANVEQVTRSERDTSNLRLRIDGKPLTVVEHSPSPVAERGDAIGQPTKSTKGCHCAQ